MAVYATEILFCWVWAVSNTIKTLHISLYWSVNGGDKISDEGRNKTRVGTLSRMLKCFAVRSATVRPLLGTASFSEARAYQGRRPGYS